MSDIISKIIDNLIKEKSKLPQVMIIIFIFSLLFPNETIQVKNIVIAKIQIILPVSFNETLAQLQFSQKEFLTVWSCLLIIYMFVVISNAISQILKGKTTIIIDSSGKTLFEINSLIFSLMLIYIRFHGFIIEDVFSQFSSLYLCLLTVSGIIFILFFVLSYFAIIILICKRIKIVLLSKIRKLLN